jgi:3-deoxy-D-manno-octulosonic acid kinase
VIDPVPPPGFVARRGPLGLLLAAESRADELLAAGLDREAGWTAPLGSAHAGAGRGATARLDLSGGPVRLKQLRRGGGLAVLWRDRFAGPRRPLANLELPLEARRRGVVTPAPLGLFVTEGPPGLCRAWMAAEEIGGARDLATCFASAETPVRDELESVLQTVRGMHDAGVEHRDLNLGNLLLRREATGSLQVWVLDLDRARMHEAGLPFRLRQRALRRLERSYVKLFAARGAGSVDDPRELFFDLYGSADSALAERLRRGRRTGRLLLLLHRIGRY